MQDEEKHFILLHGAWHDSRCWHDLIPLLEKTGCNVSAPDLPGHGKDHTLFTNISLQTYVDAVIHLIKQKSEPVILVGHSMAGAIMTQVAEQEPNAIEQLIYIAAFVPVHKSSVMLEARRGKSHLLADLLTIDETNNTFTLNVSDPNKVKTVFYENASTKQFNRIFQTICVEPLSPMSDFIRTSREHFGKVKKRYIECVEDIAVEIENQRRMAHHAGIQDVISLKSDHFPMICKPFELLKAILKD